MFKQRLLIGFILLALVAGCAAPGADLQGGEPLQPGEKDPAPGADSSTDAPALVPQVSTSEPASSVDLRTPQPTETARVLSPGAGPHILTLADNRAELTLQIGEQILLQLGDGYEWMLEVNPAFLAAVEGAAPAGSQGVYQAVQAGEITLSASGDPLCRKLKPPCGMPSVFFQVKLIIR